jgi:hypothetical protein
MERKIRKICVSGMGGRITDKDKPKLKIKIRINRIN